MQITKHEAAGSSYTLADKMGDVLEKGEPMLPLFYLHGDGLLLPGWVASREGTQANDAVQVILPADQTVDATHPLAGKAWCVSDQVVFLRDAV